MADEKLQTEFITELADLNRLLVDDTKDLHDFYIVNENVLMVTWKFKEEFSVGGAKVKYLHSCLYYLLGQAKTL